jgi:hypothetical protein
MLTEKDFYDYFAEETISIGFVSTQKPEEPKDCLATLIYRAIHHRVSLKLRAPK